jgi:hypothetical protein
MTAHVHVFDAREGGAFRMSLTYKDSEPSPGGKTSEGTDTFQGRFAQLVAEEKIVEVIEFPVAGPGVRRKSTPGRPAESRLGSTDG